MKETHRFIELDSLRGLAALAVVLGHFRGGLGNTDHPVFAVATHVLGSGHAAVVLFFLLSGFVLTTSYLGDRKPTYAAFLMKRICRIYLPYAAAILIAAAFAWRLYSTTPTGDAWIDQTWSEPFSLHLLLQHMLMIGHYDYNQLNTAIWTLIIEMRISLVFPLLAWVTARARALPTLAAFVPLTIAIASFYRSGHQFFCDTLFYVMVFALGSIMRRRYHQISAWLAHVGGWRSIVVLLVGYSFYQMGDTIPFGKLGASAAMSHYLCDWTLAAAGAVILLMASHSTRVRHLLHGSAVRWAGSRSYSIYLLHGTVLFTLIRTHHGLSLSWRTLATYLVVTGLGAEAFHRFVEEPSTQLGRQLGARIAERRAVLSV